MHIVISSSEVAPYSKTGGLGDVTGTLPIALAEADQRVTVFTPLYREVRHNAGELGLNLESAEVDLIPVPVGETDHSARLIKGKLPDSDVTVYFVENNYYYDRSGLYVDPEAKLDYHDNSERFIFFSRAVMLSCLHLGLKVDVFHSHDWQTGLIPAYHKHLYKSEFADAISIFTVHNIAYQGLFWHWNMNLTGLPRELFNWRQLEFFGNLSLLKGGLVNADGLTTVSRQYAREIQTEEFGMNMEGIFRERVDDLKGIVNGVDYSVWNPESDDMIPANYSPQDLSGKATCKAELQKEFGLPCDKKKPVIGLLGRLVHQKGFDLVLGDIRELMDLKVQIIMLGKGEKEYDDTIKAIAKRYPEQFAARIEFDERIAHLIEAGADMLLMPSRFEPCGLNQLYSMKYGTVPLASETGGFVDTIRSYGDESDQPTGFLFKADSPEAIIEAVEKAVKVYSKKPKRWQELISNGMAEDWSWARSAREYIDFFNEKKQSAVGSNL